MEGLALGWAGLGGRLGPLRAAVEELERMAMAVLLLWRAAVMMGQGQMD